MYVTTAPLSRHYSPFQAHLGILEFIMQLDLPIDYICGVSIGAFVGGVWALHQDLDKVEDRVRKLLKELETPSRYSSDMTVPYSSMYTGQCFDEFVQSTFNDVRMEDLWVPFFPVTTGKNYCNKLFGPNILSDLKVSKLHFEVTFYQNKII